MATGITPLKQDLVWRLKDMARCLPMAGVSRAVLVDTAVVTKCKVPMAALQALVDILQMVKQGITAATRVDFSLHSDTTVQLGGPLLRVAFLQGRFQNTLHNHDFVRDHQSTGIRLIRS